MRRQREEGRREIGYEPHRAYHPIHIRIHILDSSISLLYFSSSHLRPWGSQICPGQIGQVSQQQLQLRRRHLIGPNVTRTIDRQTHGGRGNDIAPEQSNATAANGSACLLDRGFRSRLLTIAGEDMARSAQKRPHIIYGASKVSRNPFSNRGQTEPRPDRRASGSCIFHMI